MPSMGKTDDKNEDDDDDETKSEHKERENGVAEDSLTIDCYDAIYFFPCEQEETQLHILYLNYFQLQLVRHFYYPQQNIFY